MTPAHWPGPTRESVALQILPVARLFARIAKGRPGQAEQFENPLAVDHRADLYSLGVVFYEMLTGELPLGRFALPSQKAAVDARLDELVLHTLENDPAKRCQQASELRTQVEAITGVATKLSPEVSRKLSFE